VLEKVDAVVIGAGVVGLACARALAMHGHDTLLLEQHAAIGSETSARNSEVIHAGIYYPHGSLKATLCVEGQRLLYDYCATHGIAHQRCGKLIVASNAQQEAQLAHIARHASANGVAGLRLLNRAQATALEPALQCLAALHSPETGIIDSHGLMLSLLGQAERYGASLALKTPVLGAETHPDGIVVHTGGSAPSRVLARYVVNAAGHAAPALARQLAGVPPHHVPRAYLAKGNYFSLNAASAFSHLIYPVPEPGGLGIHLTLDLAGRARFGPDVEWTEQFDYTVDPARGARFYAAIRKYWPALPDHALQPDYSGIRPKISGPGQADADFCIQTGADHGVAGLVNLYGIESPGLTASLAIANYVVRALGA